MAKLKKRTDGRYQKQVLIGKSENGTRRYKTFYGTKQKDVERAVAEYKAALQRGMDPDQAGATFGQLYDNYIAVKQAQGLGAKSLARLSSGKAHWGHLLQSPAADLRAADFQRALNELASWHDGTPPLSHWTLSNLRSTARAVYTLAIPEVVLYNPLDKVSTPAGAPPKTRDSLTEEQQAWVRDTPHRAQRAAMLMLYSGLRRGEATALTWADIDLKAGTISISKSYDFGACQVKGPKTAAGYRTINIPGVLVDFLAQQQDECMYVLHSSDGRMLTEQAWKRLWQSYMVDLNAKYGYSGKKNKNTPGGLPIVIKTFTPHQLRHTFCTLLYLSGVDVLTAKDQMGHADISVTMGIYTHLDKQHKRSSMSKLDDYINKSAASQ